jgi:hypothetical protein
VAVEQKLIPSDTPANKGAVRDCLRRLGLEQTWIEMQGYVYGARMQDTQPFPGVREFVLACRRAGIDVCVISHKTKHPFAGPQYDLHKAASDWLNSQDFFNGTAPGSQPTRFFFELTKQAKLQRIGSECCDWFVDDLPEFLGEADFPARAQRILFDPNYNAAPDARFIPARSWDDITATILRQRAIAA